jgi:chitin disaccharide deacetylase
MKLIVRADDLGFTDAVNHGIHKAIREGIVTSTGLMTNMPDAQAGYNLVKNYEHISIGQHTNLSAGMPCSDPSQIPSLVDNDGKFYPSQRYRKAFKEGKDLITFEDAIVEVRAQLVRFREITGKEPDYFEGHAIQSNNFFKALEYVAEENNLLYVPFGPIKSKNAYCVIGKPPRLLENNMYDPLSYILNNEGDILDKDLALIVTHPGYIDQDLLDMSSWTMIRPLEVEVLTSSKVKEWIIENRVELVNFNIF